MINYISISHYQESYDDNHASIYQYDEKTEYYKQVNSDIKTTTTNEYVKLLIDNYKNKEYSLLEVIPSDKVNIFFDIDNVVNDNQNEYYYLNDLNVIYDKSEFINNLIIDLMNFFGFVKYPVITSNIYYSAKKTYHLIFPYYTSIQYLNYMVINFLNSYPKYQYYLDPTIYTPYFLFRSIGSFKPAKPNKVRKNNNVHNIIFTKYSNKDYDIKKTLIQYTDESEYYKPGLILKNYKKLILKNHYIKINKFYIPYKFVCFLLFILNILLTFKAFL